MSRLISYIRRVFININSSNNDVFKNLSGIDLESLKKAKTGLEINKITIGNWQEPFIIQEENKSKEVLLLTVITENDLDDFEIGRLKEQFRTQAVVIFAKLENKQSYQILWKDKEIEEFLVLKQLKIIPSDSEKIYQFIAEFLADSLSHGYLGINQECLATNDTELQHFVGFRGLNLIQFAAFTGNAEIVRMLLTLGCNIESTTYAQLIALQERQSEVLIVFARANLPYPPEIDLVELSNEFRTFFKATEDLHQAIRNRNTEICKVILKDNQKYDKLKYFYNLKNESAAKIAIDLGFIEIYEILIINEVFLSPQEIANDIFENLEYNFKRHIRDIHTKHSKDHPDNYINILMVNSYSAHDGADVECNLNLVKQVYKQLSKNPFCEAMLKVVAASRKTEFHYDFERESVNIVDPTNSANTEGVFYPGGRIYIGAKLLITQIDKSKAMAVIAHEICHCAVNLVYSNHAKPYLTNDHKTMQDFHNINLLCEEKKGDEEIVSLVYNCYPIEMHHAELIVRVPHMMIHYQNDFVKLEEKRNTFKELFEFAEKTVLPEMLNAIPEIKKRERKEIEEKEKKFFRLRRHFSIYVILSLLCMIFLTSLGFFIFHQPSYTFGKLSSEQKQKVFKGLVIYKNVEVKLVDLFPSNSTAYYRLTSDHISQIFSKKALNFSNEHFGYLTNILQLNWSTLTAPLKEKILRSNFTFQNESLKFETLDKIAPKSFDLLSSQQIKDVLDGKSLAVGKMISNDTDYYVERKFTLRFEVLDLRKIYASHADDYTFRLDEEENVKAYYLSNLATNKSLDGSKIYVKQEYPDIILSFTENLSEVTSKAFKSRFLILSDEAGTGKTFTFEQLAMKLKREYPTKWISYIDLKDFTKFYNSSGILENLPWLLENILRNELKTDFDKEVFRAEFNSGQVLLLWNGFDEISPKYNKFIENVMQSIHRYSSNVQFVCTRPLYAEQLEQSFNVTSYGLHPFTEKEQKEFLYKFFKSQNVSEDEIESSSDKVYGISEKQNFKTPLMLKLIAEVHEDAELFKLTNLFKVYKSFIAKKVDIWQEKSSFAKELTKYFLLGEYFDIMKIYQKYALLNEFFLNIHVKNLKIMKLEIPKNLPLHEISRMGILYINSVDQFEFAHKTFAEFFVAQFLIENIYLAADNSEFDENILNMLQYLQKNEVVASFIIDFIDDQTESSTELSKGFKPEIRNLFLTKYSGLFFKMIYLGIHPVFEMLFKFFSRDKELLALMLRVNESATLFTTAYDPIFFARDIDPNYIKFLSQDVLDPEQYSMFITGKNQKGKILFGIALYETLLQLPKIHSEYHFGPGVTFNYEFLLNFYDNIKGDLTKNEQKELLVYLLSNPRSLFLLRPFQLHDYITLWEQAEKILNEEEKKFILGSALGTCNQLFNYDYIFTYLNVSRFLLNQTELLMTDLEIFEIFKSNKILQKSLLYHDIFEQFWEFFTEHTNEKQQKEILLLEDSYGRIDASTDNGGFDFYQDFSKFNIFGYSLFSRIKFGSFPIVAKIYENYFNKTEIQNLIVKSNQFMVHMMTNTNEETTDKVVEFFAKIFDENKEMLQEFLMRKIGATDYTIFNYFEGLKLDFKPQLDTFMKFLI